MGDFEKNKQDLISEILKCPYIIIDKTTNRATNMKRECMLNRSLTEKKNQFLENGELF